MSYDQTDGKADALQDVGYDVDAKGDLFGGVGDAQQPDKSNLIVNYIPFSVSEPALLEMFSPFGEVEKVKIVCDRMTKQSLGYGFVKFKSPESAAAAIEKLNGYNIENKRLKVSVARPPHPKSPPLTNLFVKGLPFSLKESELAEVFRKYGNVLECRLILDQQTKNSRGMGFVRMETAEHCVKAMAALNGITMEGSAAKLHVKIADNAQSGPRRPQMVGGHFGDSMSGNGMGGFGQPRFGQGMGRMPFDRYQQGLYAQATGGMQSPISFAHQPPVMNPNLMGVYGQGTQTYQQAFTQGHLSGMSSSISPSSSNTGGQSPVTPSTSVQGLSSGSSQVQLQANGTQTQSTGSTTQQLQSGSGSQNGTSTQGSVGVSQQAQLSSVLSQTGSGDQKNGAGLDGQGGQGFGNSYGQQGFFGQRGPQVKNEFPGVCLFIYHLPPNYNEHNLFELFSNYGQVLCAKVMKDLKTGFSKGFGFVNMSTKEQAAAAIQSLNGFQIGNKHLQVSYKTEGKARMM